MPHKRAKRSIRLANTQAAGTDNPPTAGDSLLPITTTAKDGTPGELEAGKTRSNKRRKAGGPGGGQQDLAGVSKAAYRVLNAAALRDEYHAKKKRKLEEDKGTNANQKKKTAMTPLPYESLASFNRRVEQEMRSGVRSAIKDAGAAAKKKRERKEKAKKGDDEDDEEEEEQQHTGKGKPPAKKAKPTPEEAIDPYASHKLQKEQQEAARNRTGKVEFDSAPLRRRVDDVVQAPPTLAKPARKGLMAKVLGPGGAASSGVTSEGGSAGGSTMNGAEAPVGSSRLPVNPAMKALLDAERERAVKMYRELKEKKEKERSG
ncbi:hypothetical protein JCM10213_005643 [Rhodosporidiobolus nylandii]